MPNSDTNYYCSKEALQIFNVRGYKNCVCVKIKTFYDIVRKNEDRKGKIL